MSPARTIAGRGAPTRRAAIAVAALYALVLQAVLGGIATLPSAAAFGTLCLQTPDDATAPGPPRGAAHHTGLCCAAPQAVAAIEPSAEAGAAAWPRRASSRLTWCAESFSRADVPSGTVASARAPPVV